jgi:hypothetical protein
MDTSQFYNKFYLTRNFSFQIAECKHDKSCEECMPKICNSGCQENCDQNLIKIIVTLALNLKLLLNITALVAVDIKANIQLKVLLYLLLLLDLKVKLSAIVNVTVGLSLKAVAQVLGLIDLNANVLLDTLGLKAATVWGGDDEKL